jgi:D-lactate dehydrogenase
MQMKKGSYLVNTARGGLIQTEAIVKALEEEVLEGVGLDVLEGEKDMTEETEVLTNRFRKKEDLKTLVLNHILINHPKVLITPHNAFNSTEALMRIENTTIENIQNYLKGTPKNCII